MNISSEAYAEVDEFLCLIDDRYVIKIPKKLRDFFKEHKSKDYHFKIDQTVPLKNQDLHPDTLTMLALLNLDYWCEDDIEKMKLTEIYKENEKRYQEMLKEKYNTNFLFNKEKVEKIAEEISDAKLVTYDSKPFYKKILDEIKRLFGL